MKIKKEYKRKIRKTTAELTGTIERLFISGEKFSAGKIKSSENNALYSFKGFFMIEKNQSVKLFGEWVEDKKFGRQFSAQGFEFIIPADKSGMIKYICNHPEMSGIGKSKAKIITEKYADELNNNQLSADDPDDVNKIHECGLSISNAKNFLQIWNNEASFNQISQILSAGGLSYSQINKLVKIYGSGAEMVIKSNPYCMIEDIHGIGFRIADDIAIKFGMEKTNPERIRAGAIYILRQNERNGSTLMNWSEFLKTVNKLLIMDCENAVILIKDEIKRLVDEDFKIARVDGDIVISLLSTYDTAFEVSEVILSNINNNAIVSENAVKAILDTYPKVINEQEITPTPEQIKAVYNSFRNRFSVYTGGAGTGKTFIAKIITEIALYNGLSVALAAPTGKAAQRMETVIKQPAKTIHRLLEYDPTKGGFQRDEENPIEAEIIIIDEVSMLDIFLTKSLINAIDFNKSSLIFIGDHNQLPAVGAGNVLSDLIHSNLIPVVVLDKIMRQAGVLKQNCMNILIGEFQTTTTQTAWETFFDFKTPQEYFDFIKSLITYVFPRYKTDFFNDVQILTPQKIGELGTKSINRIIQKIVQEYHYDIVVNDDENKKELYIGDKVIQMRNNYKTDVMNGTLGRVVDTDFYSKTYKIKFENNDKIIDIKRGSEEWNDIELAYALTVHKSQGSEFPVVILLMSKSHQFMHNRNWLYTAVTRAQKTAMILGDRLAMNRAVTKIINNQRNTWLLHLLKQYKSEEQE